MVIKIHICIFLQNTHPNPELKLKVGGVSNQILQLISSYEKIDDVKISVVTKYSEYVPKTNKIEIHQTHKFKNFLLDTIFFHIKSFFKIIKIHKKKRIDIINIHQYYHIIISPFVIRLIFKIPILMKMPIDFSGYFRDTLNQERHKLRSKILNYSWFKFFRILIFKKINFVRAINKKIYRDLISLDFPKKNILKLPNGISNKRFLEIKKNIHHGTNYGYVGRLVELKNLRFLLNVFKLYLYKYPLDKLLFFGKGAYEEAILKFIKKNQLINNIFICGLENDKTKIYSNINVLIDPALSQGISNSNLEAMCTNTLVIASNVYGNRDLIKHGVTGLLFNPYNKKNLLEQLLYYKENENHIHQILYNARNEISLNYDIDIIANKIHKFLKLKLNL